MRGFAERSVPQRFPKDNTPKRSTIWDKVKNAAAAAKKNASGQTRERIVRAYRECLARHPSDFEITLAEEHLHSEPIEGLAGLYQSLFASPEFRFLN